MAAISGAMTLLVQAHLDHPANIVLQPGRHLGAHGLVQVAAHHLQVGAVRHGGAPTVQDSDALQLERGRGSHLGLLCPPLHSSFFHPTFQKQLELTCICIPIACGIQCQTICLVITSHLRAPPPPAQPPGDEAGAEAAAAVTWRAEE
eukprot:SAG11_NODE_1249_length_5393_cov_4.349641_6_plen_147_part_00